MSSPLIWAAADGTTPTAIRVSADRVYDLENLDVKGGVWATPQGGSLPPGFTPTFNGFESGGFWEVGLPTDGFATFTFGLEVAATVAPGTYTFWLVGMPGTSVAHLVPLVVQVSVAFSNFSSVANSIETFSLSGCIDSEGVSTALQSKLAAAQSVQESGQTKATANILSALQLQVQAEQGRHISANCPTDQGTVEAAAVLIENVGGLIGNLSASP